MKPTRNCVFGIFKISWVHGRDTVNRGKSCEKKRPKNEITGDSHIEGYRSRYVCNNTSSTCPSEVQGGKVRLQSNPSRTVVLIIPVQRWGSQKNRDPKKKKKKTKSTDHSVTITSPGVPGSCRLQKRPAIIARKFSDVELGPSRSYASHRAGQSSLGFR